MLQHLLLVALALGAAIIVALPLALALERARSAAEPLIGALGVLETIPSIALLAFMIPLFGIGVKPALVALWIYALYPIVRSAYSGVRDADPSAVEAAEALGMTPWQRLLAVRLPLAAPVIMAGIRTAAVITVGAATLAAFIGAGGLGEPIVAGLALADTNMILSRRTSGRRAGASGRRRARAGRARRRACTSASHRFEVGDPELLLRVGPELPHAEARRLDELLEPRPIVLVRALGPDRFALLEVDVLAGDLHVCSPRCSRDASRRGSRVS